MVVMADVGDIWKIRLSDRGFEVLRSVASRYSRGFSAVYRALSEVQHVVSYRVAGYVAVILRFLEGVVPDPYGRAPFVLVAALPFQSVKRGAVIASTSVAPVFRWFTSYRCEIVVFPISHMLPDSAVRYVLLHELSHCVKEDEDVADMVCDEAERLKPDLFTNPDKFYREIKPGLEKTLEEMGMPMASHDLAKEILRTAYIDRRYATRLLQISRIAKVKLGSLEIL